MMLTTRRMIILLLTLFMAGTISVGQVRPETTMKRAELAQAAAVLKALTEDWALVDKDPEIDFLVFVSENREELDFYP